MSEIHSLARMKRTDFICDHCGEGRMIFTGASWEIKAATHPVGTKLFCHRCEICGLQVNYTVVYPRTEYIHEENQ
jgi:hypothetical protein